MEVVVSLNKIIVDEGEYVTCAPTDAAVKERHLAPEVREKIIKVPGMQAAINSLEQQKADKTEVEAINAAKPDRSELHAAIIGLGNRIDSFERLEDGSTTGDVELMDIRNGADGNIYNNAGSAIRYQLYDIKRLIEGNSGMTFIDYRKNQYIKCNEDTGEEVSLDPVATTTYQSAVVDCVGGDVFTINGSGGGAPRAYAFVDSANRMISKSGVNANLNMQVITAPEGAAKLIVNSKPASNPLFVKGRMVDSRINSLSSAYLTDCSKAIRLESDAAPDLNYVIDVGNYYIPTTPDAMNILNTPADAPGRLTVQTILYGVILQTYDANTFGGRKYWRIRDGLGVWGEWKESLSVQTAKNKVAFLDYNYATRLTPADISDLDDVSETGNYVIGTTPDARGIRNTPIIAPGCFNVRTVMHNVIMQTYEAYTNKEVRKFWRNRDSLGVWHGWNEIGRVARDSRLIVHTPEPGTPFTQGMCITDKYIYVSSISSDNQLESVYRFDRFSYCYRGDVKFDGLLKHANDFAWNPEEKKIYCATGAGTDEIVVLTEELEYIKTIRFSLPGIVSLSMLDYDRKTQLWAVSGGSSTGERTMYVFRELGSGEGHIASFTYPEIYQAMSFVNGCIHAVTSGGMIVIYNIYGEVVDKSLVSKPADIEEDLLEFESITVINRSAIYGIHNHTDGKSYVYSTPLEQLFDVPTLY